MAASLPATSWADQTCARLLTASLKTNIAPLETALKDTPTGRAVYEQLSQALAVNPTTYSEFAAEFANRPATVSGAIDFMIRNRRRLVTLLNRFLKELPGNDPLFDMVKRVRNLLLSGVSGSLYKKMMKISAKLGNKPWQASFNLPLLNSYYMNSYTYISELMTALEVRGLVYSNVHFYQMLPQNRLRRIAAYFKQKYSSEWLNYEIDAVTVDRRRGEMTWFEVKHFSHKIEGRQSIPHMVKRIENLGELIRAIQSDPELQALFPYKIKIRYVIWGGGISPEACARIQKVHGVTVEDRSVQNFNYQFGLANRSAAGF